MCIRIIARKNGAQLRLYSRPGNELTHRFPRTVDAPCIIDGEAVACDYNGVASFDLVRHHRAQSFPLNLPTNRRLCSTVGRRIVEGWTAHCCAVSAARFRAAIMTNLARLSLALALPARFGAAKSCALVNLFMICPRGRLMASRQRPGIGYQTLYAGRGHGPFCGAFPTPRNHIVPQQINVRVAIRYRTAQAIEKFGTVKRNRADQMHSWRAVTVLSLRPRMQYRDAMQALGLSETEATQFFQGR